MTRSTSWHTAGCQRLLITQWSGDSFTNSGWHTEYTACCKSCCCCRRQRVREYLDKQQLQAKHGNGEKLAVLEARGSGGVQQVGHSLALYAHNDGVHCCAVLQSCKYHQHVTRHIARGAEMPVACSRWSPSHGCIAIHQIEHKKQHA